MRALGDVATIALFGSSPATWDYCQILFHHVMGDVGSKTIYDYMSGMGFEKTISSDWISGQVKDYFAVLV